MSKSDSIRSDPDAIANDHATRVRRSKTDLGKFVFAGVEPTVTRRQSEPKNQKQLSTSQKRQRLNEKMPVVPSREQRASEIAETTGFEPAEQFDPFT